MDELPLGQPNSHTLGTPMPRGAGRFRVRAFFYHNSGLSLPSCATARLWTFAIDHRLRPMRLRSELDGSL